MQDNYSICVHAKVGTIQAVMRTHQDELLVLLQPVGCFPWIGVYNAHKTAVQGQKLRDRMQYAGVADHGSWDWNGNLPIQPARPPQSRVQHVGSVGG